jgi:hypothetical protein
MKDKRTGLGFGAPIVADLDVDFSSRIPGGGLVLQLKYATSQYQYMQENFDVASYVIPASLIDEFFERLTEARNAAKKSGVTK